MRLDKEQVEFIVGTIRELDPEARVYLFGSRVSDEARGGDIDLLFFALLPVYVFTMRSDLNAVCQSILFECGLRGFCYYEINLPVAEALLKL